MGGPHVGPGMSKVRRFRVGATNSDVKQAGAQPSAANTPTAHRDVPATSLGPSIAALAEGQEALTHRIDALQLVLQQTVEGIEKLRLENEAQTKQQEEQQRQARARSGPREGAERPSYAAISGRRLSSEKEWNRESSTPQEEAGEECRQDPTSLKELETHMCSMVEAMSSIEQRCEDFEHRLAEHGEQVAEHSNSTSRELFDLQRKFRDCSTSVDTGSKELDGRLTDLIEARVDDAKSCHLQVWQAVLNKCRALEERATDLEGQVGKIKADRIDVDADSMRRQAAQIGELEVKTNAQLRQLEQQASALEQVAQRCDSNSVGSKQLAKATQRRCLELSERVRTVEESLFTVSERVDSLADECDSSKKTCEAGLLVGVKARVRLESELERMAATVAEIRDALDTQDAWRDEEITKALRMAQRAEVKAQNVDLLEQELRRVVALKEASFTTRCLVCSPAGTGGLRAKGDAAVLGPGFAPSGVAASNRAASPPRTDLASSASEVPRAQRVSKMRRPGSASTPGTPASLLSRPPSATTDAKSLPLVLMQEALMTGASSDNTVAAAAGAAGSATFAESVVGRRGVLDLAATAELPPREETPAVPRPCLRPLTAKPRVHASAG